jgi:hypothetical protein
MEERPEGMTLQRIDENGNFEPKNCHWAESKRKGKRKRKKLIRELILW